MTCYELKVRLALLHLVRYSPFKVYFEAIRTIW